MRNPIRTLNTIAVCIGGFLVAYLIVLLLVILDDLELPDYEPIYILVGGEILLLFNWFGIYSYLRGRLLTWKAIVPMVVVIAVLGIFGLAFLDSDGVELIFGVVGFGILGEAVVLALYALLRYGPKTAKVFLQVVGGLLLLGSIIRLSVEEGGIGTIGFLLMLLINGWAVYAFVRYRQGRQDELAQLLAAAVAGGVPLAPAVRSYADDRPKRSTFRKILGWVACFAFPLYGYTRLWIGWQRYDRLVEELAERLEAGEALSTALRAVPGVSERRVRLAAAVGEATGTLESCLRGAYRERWSAAWFEVAPRLLYPFALLWFVLGITSFLMIYIIPKFKRIFYEFDQDFPPVTQALIAVWETIEMTSIIPLTLLFGIVVSVVLIANPTARWHTPIFGRLYRWGVQATVLRTLGRLLAVGQTVPQALGFLRDSDDLPPVVQRRLAIALANVLRGDTLDDSLDRAELLPPSMAPLVRSAERVRTLPWALGELGDHLADRAFKLVRRVSLFAAPSMVVAVGALVGFVVLGIFMPLIHLLSRVGE